MLLQVDKLGKVAVTVEENYWSENKDYDKLTIVERQGMFGTYISRKPVPAGTPLTNRTYWLPFSSLKEEIVLQFNNLLKELSDTNDKIDKNTSDLYIAMRSIVVGGVSLKQEFGDDEYYGISQKFLTQVIDNIQNQINAIYGGSVFGINLSASPDIIQNGVSAQIIITGTIAGNKATEFGITVNGETTVAQNVNTCSVTVTLSETTVVTSYAIQDGLRYESSITIESVPVIKYGSGTVYTNAINTKLQHNPKGTYEITVQTAGNYIFFVIPATMEINKATMNGFEFPLENPVEVEIEDISYLVYKSSNTYDAETLTIEIE